MKQILAVGRIQKRRGTTLYEIVRTRVDDDVIQFLNRPYRAPIVEVSYGPHREAAGSS